MRAASPLFSTLTYERSLSPQLRRPCNHTTYWIRFSDSNPERLSSKEGNYYKYVEYLRQLKPYNYILVTDRIDAVDRINIVIQYQTPTIIDMLKLPSGVTIRESPMRLYKERLIHTLKTECNIIEEGGSIDYELIDKQFGSVKRAISPISNHR